MGKPVGKASRRTAQIVEHMLSRYMLDVTFGDLLSFPLNIRIAAFRSLGERFTRGRFCNYKVKKFGWLVGQGSL